MVIFENECFRLGDLVKIKQGEYLGIIGKITEFSETRFYLDCLTVEVESIKNNIKLYFWIHQLEKFNKTKEYKVDNFLYENSILECPISGLKVGDFVKVIGKSNHGRQGKILEIIEDYHGVINVQYSDGEIFPHYSEELIQIFKKENKMKYKVGDKVKLKNKKEIIKIIDSHINSKIRFTLTDYMSQNFYSGMIINLIHKTLTIHFIGDDGIYSIKESNFGIREEMIEGLEEKCKFKSGEIIEVRNFDTEDWIEVKFWNYFKSDNLSAGVYANIFDEIDYYRQARRIKNEEEDEYRLEPEFKKCELIEVSDDEKNWRVAKFLDYYFGKIDYYRSYPYNVQIQNYRLNYKYARKIKKECHEQFTIEKDGKKYKLVEI